MPKRVHLAPLVKPLKIFDQALEGYLWMVSWLDGRIWTEIKVLTSNLTWLGGRIWTETLCCPKILVYGLICPGSWFHGPNWKILLVWLTLISKLRVVKYKFWFDLQAAMQFGWCYTSGKLIRFFEQLKFNLKILGENWTQSQDKLKSPRMPGVKIRLASQNFNFNFPILRPLP